LKKFLIIQTASIGDVILITPIIEKLHNHFPESSIDLLIKKGNQTLFYHHPFLNQIIQWDKSEKKYRNMLDIINHIRDKKYDFAINVQRFLSTGIITVLSGARKTIGFNKNPLSFFFSKRVKHRIKNSQVHETERNLKLINSITDDSKAKVKLYPSTKDYAKTSQYKTITYICIAPASLWFTKQYPVEKWVEFINEVDQDYRIYVIGAANDKAFCDQITTKSKNSNILNLCGQLNLLETAALMKDAHMNFVNDSAPQHLASAVNAAVTSIFCSTVSSFGFGPLSDNSDIVETTEELVCRPCGIHGHQKCPEDHFKCAMTIKKEQLLMRL